MMDFVHKQPFGAKKKKIRCWRSEAILILYSDILVALMCKKVFTLQYNTADMAFLLYFWISVVSPCYQMSKPLQPKLVLILLIVQKLGVKSLLVPWTRLQERD